jgi:rieske iron-sulfur protein
LTAQRGKNSAAHSRPCCRTETFGDRRSLLGAGVVLGVGLLARPSAAQSDPEHERPKEGDLLVRLDSTSRTPLAPGDLTVGAGPVEAWPMDPQGDLVRDGSRLNKILLLRLDPAVLQPPTRDRATDGVVAYSAICPHAGCEVLNWVADRQILECPCHNSQYDPKAGARVVGGPSPRSLAALPLRSADGKLVVARPFIGRLGIQQV